MVSLFLLLCAAGLMISHVRTWRLFRRQDVAAEELDYRRRQLRRRMQTSAMLALLAVALFAGRLILTTGPPLLALIFWVGVLLVVGWVGLLALVDIWATKHHFGRLRQTYLIEEAKLQAELRRIQAARGNGKARKKGQERKKGQRPTEG